MRAERVRLVPEFGWLLQHHHRFRTFVVHAPEKKLGIGVTLLNQWHKLL